MGDAADMLLDGTLDWDGSYDPYNRADGYYPRSIPGAEDDDSYRHGRPANPTNRNRVNGIVGWLERNPHINIPRNNQYGTGTQQIILQYGKDMLNKTEYMQIIQAISDDFKPFTLWAKRNFRHL